MLPSLEKIWLKSHLNWQEEKVSLMFCLYKYWKPTDIESKLCKLWGKLMIYTSRDFLKQIFLSYMGSADWPTPPLLYFLAIAGMRGKASQVPQMKHHHENLSSPTTLNSAVQGKLLPSSHGQSKPQTGKSMCFKGSGPLALICLF